MTAPAEGLSARPLDGVVTSHRENVMHNLVLDTVARLLLAVPGHRGCCSPPSWTAYIGQRWDTFDVAPWNLYNLLWRAGKWAVARVEGA